METKIFNYLSSDGKTQIHAIKWIPLNKKYNFICQISHDMIEFIERYSNFAEYLVSKNCLVVGHDHLGHGGSVKSQEDWGYIGEPDPSDLMIKDMHKLREIIQGENENSKLPYFMLGHSMGSYLLRKYLSFYSNGLTGAIIIGTGFVNPFICTIGLELIKTITLIKGWRHNSKKLDSLILGSGPYAKFDSSGKDLTRSWLSKDIEILKKYINEPRCQFKFTLNGYLSLLNTVKFSCQKENAKKIYKNLPILIISGSDDPVGDFGEGVKNTYEMMINAGMTDVKMKLYEGDRHEILNELDKDVVYKDIENWLTEKRRE